MRAQHAFECTVLQPLFAECSRNTVTSRRRHRPSMQPPPPPWNDGAERIAQRTSAVDNAVLGVFRRMATAEDEVLLAQRRIEFTTKRMEALTRTCAVITAMVLSLVIIVLSRLDPR